VACRESFKKSTSQDSGQARMTVISAGGVVLTEHIFPRKEGINLILFFEIWGNL